MAAALVQMSCSYRGILAVRCPGIRALFPGTAPRTLRCFSLKRPEPLVEENPYFSKYQDKIQKLRSTKPEEYKERLEKIHETKNEPLGHSKQAEFIKLMEQELEKKEKMAASEAGEAGGFTKNKTLNSILDLDKIKDMTGQEVAELWMKYYSLKETISAAIPSQIYEVISSRSKACPSFLYALPQKEGYEYFLGQWAGHELHFTSLINVQMHKESAPSQLILYHFPELQEEKALVLMTAEMDPKFITVHQAQCLANQVQLFYGAQRSETFRLVETFNHRPADFKHMAVIAELEQSGLAGGSGGAGGS